EDTTAAGLVSGAVVYTDGLQAGWSDWSFSITRNLANTSPIASGTRSISVDYSAWGALYFHISGLPTATLSQLELDVNGGTTAGKQLRITATIGGREQLKPALAQYCTGGTIPANAWTHCRVPLTALGAANTTIDGFWIQEGSGLTLSRTYFDAISFTGASC